MKKLRGLICLITLLLCCSIIFVGCGNEQKEVTSLEHSGDYLTITDDMGRQVILTNKPRNFFIITLFKGHYSPLFF